MASPAELGTIAHLFAGPAFIASMLNWGLFGVLCLQIYSFSISFPNERHGIRAFVFTILVIELCQTVFSTIWAWDVLVKGWGDPASLQHISWSSITIPVTEGLVSITVQTFFAWRIYVLRRNGWAFQLAAALIVIVALMQGLSAVVNGIRFGFSLSVGALKGYKIGVSIWLAGSLACDFLIAASMVTILLQAKSNSAFKKTETLITKLIVHTVETGVVTVVTATVDLSLYLKYPNNFLHIVPALILGKLYSNIALANLNGRTRHRAWGDQTVASATQLREMETHHYTIPRVDKTIVTIQTSITEERDTDSYKSPSSPEV